MPALAAMAVKAASGFKRVGTRHGADPAGLHLVVAGTNKFFGDLHVAGTAAGAAGVDALANIFSGHELSLDGWEVYVLRITQMIMLAPVTAQTAVPAKAPIRSTSELLLVS